MQELRLVAVSEDGAYLVLASAGRGTRFMLPVDDRLRAAVRGQFSRLGHYEIEVENPLRPKEIQARIRSGETAEAIAEISGIPIERVRWFEGPVLQERQYVAQQAQQAAVRRQGESSPGQTLGDLVAERVGNPAPENGEVSWDSWKMTDSTWRVRLTFHEQGRERVAHWSYDPRRRSVAPLDEEATRFSNPDAPGARGADDGDNVALFTRRRPAADTAPPPAPEPALAPPPPAPPVPEPAPPAPEPAAGRHPDTVDPTPPPPPAPEPAARPPQRPEAPRPPARQAPPAPPAPAARQAPAPPSAPPAHQAPPAPPARQAPPAPPFPADAPSILNPPTPPKRPAPEPPPAPEPAPPAESPAASGPDPGAPAANRPARPKREPITASAAGNPSSQPAKRSRGGGKRSRRASVPSWDEIMFGSRKQD